MKRILSGAAGLVLIVFAVGFVASAARADTVTHPVGAAGSVTFSTDDGVLAFVAAETAEGWTYSVDREDGSHLKVTFRDASGAETEFEAELEDGNLTVTQSDDTDEVDDEDSDEVDDVDDVDEADEVEDEDAEDADDADEADEVDDEDADDDNSGPGNAEDDEDADDNSGPGNAEDDEDADDDDADDDTDDDDDTDEGDDEGDDADDDEVDLDV